MWRESRTFDIDEIRKANLNNDGSMSWLGLSVYQSTQSTNLTTYLKKEHNEQNEK